MLQWGCPWLSGEVPNSFLAGAETLQRQGKQPQYTGDGQPQATSLLNILAWTAYRPPRLPLFSAGPV